MSKSRPRDSVILRKTNNYWIIYLVFFLIMHNITGAMQISKKKSKLNDEGTRFENYVAQRIFFLFFKKNRERKRVEEFQNPALLA